MAGLSTPDLKIVKTIKLFVGGEFPRTESGRTIDVTTAKGKKLYAHLCRASRKDLRNAITAAQSAQPGWQGKSAYNRGQILYRVAEMMESKRQEFAEVFSQTLGVTGAQANKMVDQGVDAFVYYAGFSDKYQQVLGAVNPVSGPHHCFTSCEPMGVVGFISSAEFDFGRLCAGIASIIVSGNSLVAFMGLTGGATLAPLAEALATSDLPKGVVNLLTGDLGELLGQFGSHMEIHGLTIDSQDAKVISEIETLAIGNIKRVARAGAHPLSLEAIMNHLEFKTVWHPVGT